MLIVVYHIVASECELYRFFLKFTIIFFVNKHMLDFCECSLDKNSMYLLLWDTKFYLKLLRSKSLRVQLKSSIAAAMQLNPSSFLFPFFILFFFFFFPSYSPSLIPL